MNSVTYSKEKEEFLEECRLVYKKIIMSVCVMTC